MICTRRALVSLAVAAALPSKVLAGAASTPALLDHIMLGCSDLAAGVAYVEGRIGIRAKLGGSHPGLGTHNALISLGPRRYLEIIAPDFDASVSAMGSELKKLQAPTLIGWAEHPGNLARLALTLQSRHVEIEGPTRGSRMTPAGNLLTWSTLGLKDDAGGLLPFFIEWSRDTVHPSIDSPSGAHLQLFEIQTDDSTVSSRADALQLGVRVHRNPVSRLRAIVLGPGGSLEMTS